VMGLRRWRFFGDRTYGIPAEACLGNLPKRFQNGTSVKNMVGVGNKTRHVCFAGIMGVRGGSATIRLKSRQSDLEPALRDGGSRCPSNSLTLLISVPWRYLVTLRDDLDHRAPGVWLVTAPAAAFRCGPGPWPLTPCSQAFDHGHIVHRNCAALSSMQTH
jgi:hypothetical protein